ncbi:hypothetical protein AH06_23 [Erwinia phage AH06]|nr:hypothetical protein AH06_23 [Erwinia phage AH06]
MSSIPANLYYGPEVPDDAIPGAVFNDGVCLYRGGEHGWLYMCHVNVAAQDKDGLAAYAAEPSEDTIACLNSPMCVYKDKQWLILQGDPEIVPLSHIYADYDEVLSVQPPNDSVVLIVEQEGMYSWDSVNVTLALYLDGKLYPFDYERYHTRNWLYGYMQGYITDRRLSVKSYLELDMTARFVVNTDVLPEPGAIWVDGDFNQFMFRATRVWEFIGKLPFQFKGSMVSGMDVLRRVGANDNGDTYIVDNFLYVYNKIVNRFVVIQAAPGSDNLPFDLFLEGALEPIPIQGIYRRNVDPLPSEPNGCGYLVINEDGTHNVYNQFGLLIECSFDEASEERGDRTPVVVLGDRNYLQLCYSIEGVEPTEGDVWLNGKVLHTFYKHAWVPLPIGVLYSARHTRLRDKVNEVKARIADEKIAHVMANDYDRLFDEQAKKYNPATRVEAPVKKPRTWWRRLWSKS